VLCSTTLGALGAGTRNLINHPRIVSVLSAPSNPTSLRRTLRLTAIQPAVGEKLGRAIWRKMALPAPGCVGFML